MENLKITGIPKIMDMIGQEAGSWLVRGKVRSCLATSIKEGHALNILDMRKAREKP